MCTHTYMYWGREVAYATLRCPLPTYGYSMHARFQARRTARRSQLEQHAAGIKRFKNLTNRETRKLELSCTGFATLLVAFANMLVISFLQRGLAAWGVAR